MSNNVLNKMYHRLRNRLEMMNGTLGDYEDLETRLETTLGILKEMGDDGRLKMVETGWKEKLEELSEEVEGMWEEWCCKYNSDFSDNDDLERCYGQNVYDYQEELYYDTPFEDGIGELIKNYNTLNGTKWVFTDGGVV